MDFRPFIKPGLALLAVIGIGVAAGQIKKKKAGTATPAAPDPGVLVQPKPSVPKPPATPSRGSDGKFQKQEENNDAE